MNAMRFALCVLALFGLLVACVTPAGRSGTAARFEREETIPPDKTYGQSFVVEHKVLFGVTFEVQGGKTDAYILTVNDYNGHPKNTESFTEFALAKEMNAASGILVAELAPGSYFLLFDNPRTETIRVSWNRTYTPVGN